VIYDSNTENVTIKEELTLINNYIEFQKLRLQSVENITLNTSIEDEDFNLYPMLILPLIENSFKHGMKGDIKGTFINIDILQIEKQLSLKIKNNISKNSNNEVDLHSGLGIENIKQNLEIVYPNAHMFEIAKTKDVFTVTLKLEALED